MAFRPEKAFRIADSRHTIFDGTGAFLAGARWNSAGRRVIYAADSFAAAMLEMLVHAGIGRIPSSHKWIEITIPDTVSVEFLDSTAMSGWNDEDSDSARVFGDAWLESKRFLVLVVPSIVTGGLSSNVVVNQDHPEFSELKASMPRDVIWDVRLFRGPAPRS
jgi:RES domain-containing protein